MARKETCILRIALFHYGQTARWHGELIEVPMMQSCDDPHSFAFNLNSIWAPGSPPLYPHSITPSQVGVSSCDLGISAVREWVSQLGTQHQPISNHTYIFTVQIRAHTSSVVGVHRK